MALIAKLIYRLLFYISLKLSNTAFALPGCIVSVAVEEKKLEKPTGVVCDSFLNAIDQFGNSR